jgi:hypothetical protein
MNSSARPEARLTGGWENKSCDLIFMRKFFKVLGIILGVIIFLALLVVFIVPWMLGLLFPDIAPFDDSDIRLQKIDVPGPESNAYYDLVKLCPHLDCPKLIDEPPEIFEILKNYSATTTIDSEFAERIIASNEIPLSYFYDAASKRVFQDPKFSDPAKITPDMVLTPLNTWRQITRVSAFKALYMARQGRELEAMDEAMKSVMVGHLVSTEENSTLINYLVGVAIKSIGFDTMHKIISVGEIPSEELLKHAVSLEKYTNTVSGLASAFKEQYTSMAQSIDKIGREGFESSKNSGEWEGITKEDIPIPLRAKFYYQPNRTKQLYADAALVQIENVSQPCYALKEVPIYAAIPEGINVYFTPNAVGKILAAFSMASLNSSVHKKCEDTMLLNATRLLLALRAYHQDQGEYPEKLDELVPRYLSAIPEDPFRAGPLQYTEDRAAIYSVGSNLTDAGGSSGSYWRRMDDPTFDIAIR